jgi:SAM-dependent methyltransferase
MTASWCRRSLGHGHHGSLTWRTRLRVSGLDVACGTGVVARLAAGRVGADGRVVGLDLNPGMLAVARGLPVGGSPIG